MNIDIRKIIIGLIIVSLACASVDSGIAQQTYERNLITRMYAECMRGAGSHQIPSTDQRRHCEKLVILQKATWEWEKCVNEYGSMICGQRPRYEDVP